MSLTVAAVATATHAADASNTGHTAEPQQTRGQALDSLNLTQLTVQPQLRLLPSSSGQLARERSGLYRFICSDIDVLTSAVPFGSEVILLDAEKDGVEQISQCVVFAGRRICNPYS